MEFAETRDPLGFVGARVMRHSRKARRRRKSATASSASSTLSAMKPDLGAVQEDAANDADADEPESPPTLVLYGWLTRYDSRLDAYTLFLPDGGGATLCPRSDVLQFVANPEFQLRTDADDAWPPPVEDTTSRFVGAPIFKKRTANGTQSATKKRARQATAGSDDEAAMVAGRVVCYRPFADVYRVAYEDGSMVEVRESDVVDALLAFAKRMQLELERQNQREREQEQEGEQPQTPTTTRKRRHSEELTQGDKDDDDDETEDEALPLGGVKTEDEDRSGLQKTEPVMSPREVASPTSGTASLSGVATAEPPEPVASLSAARSEVSADAEVEYNFAHPDDDEPMELLPLDDDDDDDDDDHDMNSINAALASIQTTTTTTTKTETRPPPNVPIVEILDDDDDDADTVLPPPPSVPAVTGPRPTYYVVHAKPHAATQPLDTRSMAFEFLRVELTKLLNAEECATLEISLVSDVMTNRDIKDRDAVRRFVETGGLVVINCVLNARARDALARRDVRYDRVLFVLKLLAMLPTPSERQVMESSVGQTIGRFIKSRMHDQQASPDAAMPKCIAHLAKWIKQKWLANMKREKKTHATASSTANAKKHLQRPTLGRPSGQRPNDPAPIPRQQHSMPSRPPQIPSFAAASSGTPSTDVLGRALSTGSSSPRPQRSSLKPDWIRQKELLARTRFTINTDANAERLHYQRDRRNADSSANGAARGPGQANSNARTTDDAGTRGVYGRSQRLSFGPRWNVCEFFKDTPPSAVRRASSKSTGNYNHRFVRPKPILRKTSKYRNDLTF
jgi:hypothetical protein